MRKFGTLLGVGCVLVLGCGDDEGGAKSSGVDGSKKLVALTQEEMVKLCEWRNKLEAESGVSDEQYCTSDAVDTSFDQAECEEARDTCLEELEDSAESSDNEGESCEGVTADIVPEGCDLTVAEYETCQRELEKTFADYNNSASCDNLEQDLPAQPKSCNKVYADCWF